MTRNLRHRADAEHAAEIRAEIEAARTPSDQLSLMRGYLAELDSFEARYPETRGPKTDRLRAELMSEIERLGKVGAN